MCQKPFENVADVQFEMEKVVVEAAGHNSCSNVAAAQDQQRTRLVEDPAKVPESAIAECILIEAYLFKLPKSGLSSVRHAISWCTNAWYSTNSGQCASTDHHTRPLWSSMPRQLLNIFEEQLGRRSDLHHCRGRCTEPYSRALYRHRRHQGRRKTLLENRCCAISRRSGTMCRSFSSI